MVSVYTSVFESKRGQAADSINHFPFFFHFSTLISHAAFVPFNSDHYLGWHGHMYSACVCASGLVAESETFMFMDIENRTRRLAS